MVRFSPRVKTFAAASLAGLAVIAAGVAAYTRHLAENQLRSVGIAQHEVLARTLSAALSREIDAALHSGRGLSSEELRRSEPVVALRSHLVDPLHGMKVVRIKIYDAEGRTVFSTDPSLIGEDQADNHGVRGALAGEVTAELVHKNTFNASDGVIENRDLLEVYVPIRTEAGDRIKGVFELYSDMTELLETIGDTQRLVLLGSLIISGVVFVPLLLLFRHVDITLQKEEAATERHLDELKEARSSLEQKVDERTRELALSERRFQDVADAAGEYIWETDADGRFIFVSDRITDVLGHAPADLIGHTPLELVPESEAPLLREKILSARDDTSFVELEHLSYTKDGRLVWLSESGLAVRDESGKFSGLRGAAHDITARKEAQEDLRKMSLAIEQGSEIVIITDLAGRIEYVNPIFCRIFGYESREVVGKTPSILRSGVQSDEVFRELWRALKAGDTWRGELCNRSKDGRLFWNLVSIFPLRDSDGEITHYVGLQTDITERKRSELALRESAARLRAVMNSVGDAIITSDAEGVIDMINPAAESLFGYEPGELIGERVERLMPAPYREKHSGYMNRYLTTGLASIIGVERREVTGLRKDGTEIPLELSVGEIVMDEDRRFVGVLRDLTDVKRAQLEVERARQQFFHREKITAMGHLAAGIVHEVGNPAAAISGAVRTLRHRVGGGAEGDNGVLAANLDLIEQQADRLAAITREISDLSRPRELKHTLLDLNQVIRSAVSLMRFDPRVQDAGLTVQLDPDLPALTASHDLLTQLVINLLLNAADACADVAEGRIEVSTARVGQRALLVVSDTGSGMDEATRAHALDPYFTTKGDDRGVGLGLALCRDIVDQHRGEIFLESLEGQGTTVRVLLPLEEES